MRDLEEEIAIREMFAPDRGVLGALPCDSALKIAIDELRMVQNRWSNYPARVESVDACIKTLEAIYLQRGCESNNVIPGEPWLTGVMDVAIFG